MPRSRLGCAAPAAVLLLVSALAHAGEPTLTELAIADQNPVTRFYVARFEDNVQFGFGPDDEPLNFFRIQPLVPFEPGADWTILLRPIIPIVHVPWPESEDGLGDISLLAFVTPREAEGFVWALGSAFLLPTATDELLGTEKWSAGPAVAALYTGNPWVVGVLAQQLWSFAGKEDRADVDLMTLRPLLNYNLPRGWYLTTSPSIAANWDARTKDKWLVPLGGGVGKVFAIASQRMSTTVEAYHHVVAPSIGPEWQLRIQLSFLYQN